MASVSQTRLSKFNHSLMQLKPYQVIGALILGSICLLLLSIGWWLNRGDWIYPDQVQAVDVLAQDLVGDTTIGQTFTAYQAGLEAIEVKVHLPNNQSDQPLTLHLREGVEATQDLRQVTISTAGLTDRAWARFSFDPLPASRLKDYYFFVEGSSATTSDGISLYYGPPEAYLDGALYLSGQPQEKQLAFRLVYNRPMMAWDLVRSIVISLPASIGVLLLLICPGGALLAWLWPKHDLDWFGLLAVSMGLSIACFPLIILFAHTMGELRLVPGVVWGIILLSIVAWGYKLYWRYRHKLVGDKHEKSLSILFDNYDYGAQGTLIFLTAVIIISRLWIVRNLEIPLWGDSYQHTVVAQLLSEHGGLFDSWEPYSFSSTFTYHFGFHAFVLFLHWLSQTPMPKTVILAGQILNSLAVLLLYPLVYQLSGKQTWAGITSLLIAGLASTMPTFYVNWGRYTQLTGQVILPVAALLVFKFFRQRTWRLGILAVLATGGLALSHYRVTILFGCLIIIWLGADWLASDQRWFALKQRVMATLWFGLGIIGTLLPWLLRLATGRIPTMGVNLARRPAEILSHSNQIVNILTETFSFVPDVLGWLAVVGLIIGLRRHFVAAIVILLWLITMIFLGSPNLLNLPGRDLVSQFTVQIALYIPIALAIGLLTIGLGQMLPWSRFASWGNIGLVIILTIVLLPTQVHILDQSKFAMVTRPDERATQWIQQNVSPQALFYVDGFQAFNNSVVVGSDGGWWLPLLAKRKTTMPPLAYVFEQEHMVGDKLRIKGLITFGQINDLSTDQAIDHLRAEGITHLYVAQRRGMVGNPDLPIFSVATLLTNPRYEPIYHQDRVWIFALR